MPTMPQDIDCRTCQHYQYCRNTCPAMEIIANGHSPQRERPIPDDIIDRTGQRDYNAALAELIEDQRNRDANALEDIRAIANARTRLIAAAILAYIPQRTIAQLINHSQGRISQLYHAISIQRINTR